MNEGNKAPYMKVVKATWMKEVGWRKLSKQPSTVTRSGKPEGTRST